MIAGVRILYISFEFRPLFEDKKIGARKFLGNRRGITQYGDGFSIDATHAKYASFLTGR